MTFCEYRLLKSRSCTLALQNYQGSLVHAQITQTSAASHDIVPRATTDFQIALRSSIHACEKHAPKRFQDMIPQSNCCQCDDPESPNDQII